MPASVRRLARRLLRRAGKRWLSWRYRGFTPGSRPDRSVRIAGMTLRVARGVFDPRIHLASEPLATFLLRGGAPIAGKRVLDLGTGSGVLALAAARAGARRVVASDISQAAVECARENAARLGMGHTVEVRWGDMFEPVAGETFDYVVCNPPYFRGEPDDLLWQAYYAGSNLEWFDRFAVGLQRVLARSGVAYLTIGDAAEVTSIAQKLSDHGWRSRIRARRTTITETILIIELTHGIQPRAAHTEGNISE